MWDDLNDAVLETFGTDKTVTCKPRGRASFGLPSAIFDDGHKRLELEDGVEISTTGPALFITRRALLEAAGDGDFRFDDEDRISVGVDVYKVLDEQPDDAGGLVVLLVKMRGK